MRIAQISITSCGILIIYSYRRKTTINSLSIFDIFECKTDRKNILILFIRSSIEHQKPMLYFWSEKENNLCFLVSSSSASFYFRSYKQWSSSIVFYLLHLHVIVPYTHFWYLLHLHYFLSSQLMCSWFLCPVFIFLALPVSFEQFPERYVEHIDSDAAKGAQSHWWLCIYIYICVCVCAE